MKKKLKGRFTAHKLDQRRKLLAELPSAMEVRQQNIHNRNQMLAATQAYNLKLEKQRTQAHLSEFPAGLQKQAALEHMGDLDRRVHRLALSGLP